MFGYLDATITLLFFWMVYALGFSQAEAVNNVYYTTLAPSLFTLEFNNFPAKIAKSRLAGDLWEFLEQYLRKYSSDKKGRVFDV